MQTQLSEAIRDTADGREADRILRACVHCGFCTATCPTYQLLGDELDGPRGRIYQIKMVLEGMAPTHTTLTHLDRCLTCLNCETTCPSGVDYHRLLAIGRKTVEKTVRRKWRARWLRLGLRLIVPHAGRTALLLAPARWLRCLLPAKWAKKIPSAQVVPARPARRHARKVIFLEGCAQAAMTPRTNAVTALVLDHLGIESISPKAGCCGAMSLHLSAEDEALRFVRAIIDAFWPHVEQGAEAIVTTASGCGAMLKEYGHLLREDAAYAHKAHKISAMTKDLSEFLSEADMAPFKTPQPSRIAYHAPCTLQHAQKIRGKVESLLQAAGYELLPVADAHLCCGSAGTYSVLQPKIAARLLQIKLQNLQRHRPDRIATANVGCQLHLQTASNVPVVHWVELLHANVPRSV